MKALKKLALVFLFAGFVAAPAFALAAPQTTFAAVTSAKDCEKPILNIPPWFRGLAVVKDGQCQIASPGQTLDGASKPLELSGFIWRIALNVIDIGLTIVGWIAFFFILYGGFQFLTGGSVPGQIEKARQTILNAVIGLAIALGAVTVVNLVFGVLG